LEDLLLFKDCICFQLGKTVRLVTKAYRKEITSYKLDIGFSNVVATIGKKHMNPFGGLHGGVFSSVIDTAAE